MHLRSEITVIALVCQVKSMKIISCHICWYSDILLWLSATGSRRTCEFGKYPDYSRLVGISALKYLKYVGCNKSKFPYVVKNQKSTLKILKKFYFIPFEYIIFPHSRQKDSSIYRTSRIIFVCSIGKTACPNL